MKRAITIFSAILFAGSLYFFYLATNFVKISGQTDIGPDAFPKLICALLMLFGIFISVKEWRKTEETKISFFNKKYILALASISVFLVSFEFLGFIVAGILLEFVLTLLLCTEEKKKALPVIAVTSVVCPIVIYIIFAWFLKVPLPMGILENLF